MQINQFVVDYPRPRLCVYDQQYWKFAKSSHFRRRLVHATVQFCRNCRWYVLRFRVNNRIFYLYQVFAHWLTYFAFATFQRTFVIIFAFRTTTKEATTRRNNDDPEDRGKSFLPDSSQLLFHHVTGDGPRNLLERQITVLDAGKYGGKLFKVRKKWSRRFEIFY